MNCFAFWARMNNMILYYIWKYTRNPFGMNSNLVRKFFNLSWPNSYQSIISPTYNIVFIYKDTGNRSIVRISHFPEHRGVWMFWELVAADKAIAPAWDNRIIFSDTAAGSLVAFTNTWCSSSNNCQILCLPHSHNATFRNSSKYIIIVFLKRDIIYSRNMSFGMKSCRKIVWVDSINIPEWSSS